MSATSNYHAWALYLFSLIDPAIRFVFIPWGVLFTSSVVHGSWAVSVNFYGVLYSALLLGRIIGCNYDVFYQKHASFNLILLIPFVSNQICVVVLSYILVTLFNRYSVLFVAFIFMGIVSGRIASLVCSKKALKSITSSTPIATNAAPATPTQFGINREGSSSSFEIDSETYDKMNVIVLIFVALYSGFLYDDRPSAFFPAFYSVLLIIVTCTATILLFYLARQKSNHNISKSSLKDIFSKTHQKGVMTKLERVELPPRTFIEVCKGDVAKAKAMFEKTLAWRAENNIDKIFTCPQRHFLDILEFYPHAIHGCSLDGCRVVYEVLGKARPKELLSRGITPLLLVEHFLLRNEFIFHRFHRSRAQSLFDINCQSMVAKDLLDPAYLTEPCVQLMTIIDVKDIRISDVSTDVVSFIKQSSDIIDHHYPGRVVRLVVCNAPTWFWSVWTMIQRVLPEAVRKKIVILNDVAGLDKFIAADQRPVLYGGTGLELGSSPEHLEFLSIAESWRNIPAIVVQSETVGMKGKIIHQNLNVLS